MKNKDIKFPTIGIPVKAFKSIPQKITLKDIKDFYNNKINTSRNLKFIRCKILNLSRPKLAKLLGVSTKTIYNWEQTKELDYIKWQAILGLVPDIEPLSIGYIA